MWGSEPCRRALSAGALAALCLLFNGCMMHAIREKMTPPNYEALPAPEPTAPADGSIWPGQTQSGSFLFFDQKASGIGDLVTVVIDENISAEGTASTDLSRNSNVGATASSDVGFTGLISQATRQILSRLGVDNPGRDIEEGSNLNFLASNSNNDFEGDGMTRRAGRFRATITCRVINTLPGGVFHIRGRRSLLVNNEEQFLTVEGLVRKEDIGINNTVMSASLAEARLGLDGFGVIGERQHPGWLSRALAWIYPL